MLKFLLLPIFALLTSCGGGGGGASAGGGNNTVAFSGVAVDGYLYKARVFLDLNRNGMYDSGEPAAITDANGGFSIDATQLQIDSYPIVVLAIAGTTIDQDSPNVALADGFVMTAPAGNFSVISPLTTHVAAKVANGTSLESAKAAVLTDLGLTGVDVMKDYVAAKSQNAAYSDVHKVASALTEVLKTVEKSSTPQTSISMRSSALEDLIEKKVAPSLVAIKSAVTTDDAKVVVANSIKACDFSGGLASYKCVADMPVAYTVTTIAGSGNAGFSNGAGSSAQFYWPVGLALDAIGNIYVSDSDNCSIRKIDTAGVVSTVVGSGRQRDECLNSPFGAAHYPGGIAVDTVGNIFVSVGNSNAIYKVSALGVVSLFVGGGRGYADGQGVAATFNYPGAMTIDSADNLYVADAGNQQIRKISPTGFVTTIAGTGEQGFNDGTCSTATFNGLSGIALDTRGNIYLSDEGNNAIRKISTSCVVSTLPGGSTPGFVQRNGNTIGTLFAPHGVAVDSQGNVFVGDFGNHALRMISPSGVLSTVAGTGVDASADGSGVLASFGDITSLAIDAQGNILVADRSKNVIKKVSLTP